MTTVKKTIISSKEKTKKKRITKYLYYLEYVIPNLLSSYVKDANYKPRNEDLVPPILKNTIDDELTLLLPLKIINKDVLRYTYSYEKSVCEQLDNINYMFAFIQILASVYLDKFPGRSFQDLDGIMSLFNALLHTSEDHNMNYSIHVLINLFVAYQMYGGNMSTNNQNQIDLSHPNTWALVKSTKYLHMPRFLQLDFQVYNLRSIDKVIHNRAANNLKDFIVLYSSLPTKHIVIHFELYTTNCLNNLLTEKRHSFHSMNWTKQHAKVLEEYNLLSHVNSSTSIEKNEEIISHMQLKVPDPLLITELYEKESSHEKCNSIATNTDHIGGDLKFENAKKPSKGPFNNSLWIAGLCGDSLRTKVDFSAYILKCSCFDEVLNLDPAVKYLREVVEPLRSTIFVKIFIRDLTKTFFNTLFYFPI